MNRHSLFQVFYNMKKMLPVSGTIFLSFLVLSFAVSLTWSYAKMVVTLPVSLNYDNLYQMEVVWKKPFVSDSLQLSLQKKALQKAMSNNKDVVAVTDNPSYLFNSRRMSSSKYSLDQTLVAIVGLDFSRTFGVNLIEGRPFTEEDLHHPLPAAIILKSLAEQEHITNVTDKTVLSFKNTRARSGKENPNKQFRVVGIIDDIPFRSELDGKTYETIVFVYEHSPYSKNLSRLFVKVKEGVGMTGVSAAYSDAVATSNSGSYIYSTGIRTIEEMLSQGMDDALEEMRPVIVLLILLVIFVGGALFGVFYRQMKERMDEFAVLRSFGCTQWGIFRKALFEAILHVTPGMVAGAIVFINFGILADFKDLWEAVLISALFIIVMIIGAVFVPAVFIARQPPVVALREQ